MKKVLLFQAIFILCLLTLSSSIEASTLLVDTGPGNVSETRANDFNPAFGNGLLASIKVGDSPVTIEQFAIYGQQLTNGNIRFDIFDGSSGEIGSNGAVITKLTRVYDSGIVARPADTVLGWVLSPSFSLTLEANRTYYLGVISDQSFTFNSANPAPEVDLGLGLIALESDGKTRGINGNFGNFSDPTFNRTAWSQVALQVFGTPASTTPHICLLDWAEMNYPDYLAPNVSLNQVYMPYTYRYYENTNAYLGISSSDKHVYYLGPDRKLLDIGELSDWLTKSGCANK